MLSSRGTVTPDDFRRLRELFDAALELTPAERDAFVDETSRRDPALGAELARMLAAEAATAHRLLDERSPVGSAAGRAAGCPSCRAPVTSGHRFCPACGSPVTADVDARRFRTGALFAGRFRIVSLLGRGGMGEVYRADDLELGQAVALKFLTALRTNERARTRLRGEVRLARQIAHPNVCRVYDIGEANGELYLSMEYVDGEDLAALLTRIGRVPLDKGVDIARKLCAGLAAAHAQGVLHRDFKPSNIMIDGRGEVRIMDFGLAAIPDQLETQDIRSGTPAYMAPEQLAGKEASKQSDLYALGLVLYELFTGKPPFTTTDLEELQRQRDAAPATTPSTLIPEISPRLEQTILRCLEPDPRHRPASALEVAASLPGGDPLAEALAAGETPSPELVAASSAAEGLKPRTAAALVAATLLGLAVVLVLTPRARLPAALPLSTPPAELKVRAQDILRTAGFAVPAVDSDVMFHYDATHTARIMSRVAADGLSATLRDAPWPVYFAYQQSAAPMLRIPATPVTARRAFAPASATELATVETDLRGRLLRLIARPAPDRPATPPAIDWSPLFAAAGLDMSRFTAIPPRPGAVSADTWAAWQGTYVGSAAIPVRIEAASLGGRPTLFAVLFPWSDPERGFAGPPAPRLAAALVNEAMVGVLAFVAWYHWRRGRSDVRSALRLGTFAVVVAFGSQLAGVAPSVGSELPLVPLTAFVTFTVSYLAVEPWARRVWPQAMVTWTRVMTGRWRDPLVGRDALVALAAVTCWSAVQRAAQVLFPEVGSSAFAPRLDALLGGGPMIAISLIPLLGGVFVAAYFSSVLFVAKMVFRRTWIAAVVFLLVWIVAYAAPTILAGKWAELLWWTTEMTLTLVITLRFGLFAAAVFAGSSMLIDWSLLTYRFDAWYGQSSIIGALMIAVIAIGACRTAIGSRSFQPGMRP